MTYTPNFYVQDKAVMCQCGQAMKMGWNTLFVCSLAAKKKEDYALFYWRKR